MKQTKDDGRLLRQLYTRLNLQYIQKPIIQNPILSKYNSSMVSKSIANKIQATKKNKLNYNRESPNKHVFTSLGIVKILPKEKYNFESLKNIVGVGDDKQKDKCSIIFASKATLCQKNSRLYSQRDKSQKPSFNISYFDRASQRPQIFTPRQVLKQTSRPQRAKSAYASRKKAFLDTGYYEKNRKTSQNLNQHYKTEQNVDVIGWETQLDPENDLQTRFHTCT